MICPIPQGDHNYISHEAQSRRNVQWSPPSVCVSVCLSLAVFPHYCTDPDVSWGMAESALQLCTIVPICNRCTGFFAMTTQRRTRNVSECLYSLYAWFCYCRLLICGDSRLLFLSVTPLTKSTKFGSRYLVGYTGCQNGTKFDSLIDRTLLHITSEISELWPTGPLERQNLQVGKRL